MRALKVKRVYDAVAAADGKRILVDRLWPRGVRREDARIDLWLKEVAPSGELRRWFGHDAERWREFERRYMEELRGRPEAWAPIAEALRTGDVTLVYAARDVERNNAVVLQAFLESLST